MTLYLVCVCGPTLQLFVVPNVHVFNVIFIYMLHYNVCVCVCLSQVVVESGVVPKLVPLLASDENKIVVSACFHALMECNLN